MATSTFPGRRASPPESRVQEAAAAACGPSDVPELGARARTIYEASSEQKACMRQAAESGVDRILRRNPAAARLARQ